MTLVSLLTNQLGTLSQTHSLLPEAGPAQHWSGPVWSHGAAGQCDQSFRISQGPNISLYIEAGRELGVEFEQFTDEWEL